MKANVSHLRLIGNCFFAVRNFSGPRLTATNQSNVHGAIITECLSALQCVGNNSVRQITELQPILQQRPMRFANTLRYKSQHETGHWARDLHHWKGSCGSYIRALYSGDQSSIPRSEAHNPVWRFYSFLQRLDVNESTTVLHKSRGRMAPLIHNTDCRLYKQ